jgi:hypothetical protein
MSSVKRRIVIEEYECGGFSIFEYPKEDLMGLIDGYEVIEEIVKRLKEEEK